MEQGILHFEKGMDAGNTMVQVPFVSQEIHAFVFGVVGPRGVAGLVGGGFLALASYLITWSPCLAHAPALMVPLTVR